MVSHNRDSYDYTAKGRPGKPNTGASAPDFASSTREDGYLMTSITEKIDAGTTRYNSKAEEILFTRNQEEFDVKKYLFLVEGEERFDKLSLRNKVTLIMKKSDVKVQDWIYSIGVNDNLPKTYDDFKNQLIQFCTGAGIDDQKRFKEETWSNYVKRLVEWSDHNSIPNKQIWKKLRQEIAPTIIKMLFFNEDDDLTGLIGKLKDYEKGNRNYQLENTRSVKVNHSRYTRMEKRCYNCNRTGHIARFCRVTKEKDRSINKIECKISNLDIREVQLNGVEKKVLFDTGSDVSLIDRIELSNIGERKVETLKNRVEYTLISGEKLVLTDWVVINANYNNMSVKIKFGILDKKVNHIIIGNQDIKRFVEKVKKIPVICTIDTGDKGPISWNRPIRSFKDRQDFSKLVEELEEKGIVEPSESTWLNPIVLIRKRDDTLRFCIDFRKLNDLVALDRFPLPKISELLSILNGMKYFSTIDLKDGFFQVEIAEKDRDKTTFAVNNRLMRFKKMPQGYKNSPAIFQRGMTIVLKELLQEKCLLYIDDILVFGKTKDEHDANMELVLARLKLYGLEENKAKRVYQQPEVHFLGFKISHNKVEPTPARSQGICDYKRPNNRKSLQRFLGLINYDRFFIENLSQLASPLYKLLGKDSKYCWANEQQEAFDVIKSKWADRIELLIPDLSGDFELESDASEIGLGAVLRQNKVPVAYISRTLSKAEKNYSITDREILAALWAMEKFAYYLEGREFTLYTDHKAIEELKNKTEFGSARIARWHERINRFQFKPIYKKGEDMAVPDALSRVNHIKEIKDDKQRILELHEELKHRKKIDKDLLNRGIKVSQYRLKKILNDCNVCNRMDTKRYKTKGFIRTQRPGERVGIDIMEVIKGTRVIICIDYFTRYIWGKIVKNKEAKTIIKFVDDVNKKISIGKLVADNGREFHNTKLKEYAKSMGIELEFSIPYYHESNGRVERAIKTIRANLKRTTGKTKVKLKGVIEAYNRTIHRGLGVSPEVALKMQNKEQLLDYQDKYQKEFGISKKSQPILSIGDIVIIRNDVKKSKMDEEFKMKGRIDKIIKDDVYRVCLKSGKTIIRHISQLKCIKKGDVGTFNVNGSF